MRNIVVAMLVIGLPSCSEVDAPGNRTAVPVVANETDPPTLPDFNAAEPAPALAAALERSIPEAIRGVWRESAGDSVTTAECNLQDYENSTRSLTIRADGFSQFETGGRLLSVAERSDARIRATFDTTYADTPTRSEYVLELRDGGQTLMAHELAEGGRGPIRHRRCPS